MIPRRMWAAGPLVALALGVAATLHAVRNGSPAPGPSRANGQNAVATTGGRATHGGGVAHGEGVTHSGGAVQRSGAVHSGSAVQCRGAAQAGSAAQHVAAQSRGGSADAVGSVAEWDHLGERIARLEAVLGLARTRTSPFHTRYEELRRREARIAARADSAQAWIPDAAPLAAGTITSVYTARRYHPLTRRVLPHWGLDVAAPHGAPVFATADGVVLATFRSPSYGRGVDLRHGDAFITRYAHLSGIAVRTRAAVRRGQVIGYVGATGHTTGPHLHYETYVRRESGYQSIDPTRLLPPGGPLGL